jgi:hypothetical protein
MAVRPLKKRQTIKIINHLLIIRICFELYIIESTLHFKVNTKYLISLLEILFFLININGEIIFIWLLKEKITYQERSIRVEQDTHAGDQAVK